MARCFCECHSFPGVYPPPCGVCGHDTREGHMVGGYRDGWEPNDPKRMTRQEWQAAKWQDFDRMEARIVELERHAIAVTRMWDALARCEDEFPPGDPEVAACSEFQEQLDMAIDGLMKLVDREMWDRRQAWMRESRELALRQEVSERRAAAPRPEEAP